MKRLRTSAPLAYSWLALACTLVSAGLAPGQGTIVYHQPAEPLFGLVGLTLDLNGDGQLDGRVPLTRHSRSQEWKLDPFQTSGQTRINIG